MKKLLLITILLGGCASTAPIYEISAYERQEICKAKNIGKYWGNCHMQSVQSDPNYNKVTKHLQEYYPQTLAQHGALLVLNTGLLQQLESGRMTPDEANQLFEDRLKVYRSRTQKDYDLVAKREDEKKEYYQEPEKRNAATKLANDKREASDRLEYCQTASHALIRKAIKNSLKDPRSFKEVGHKYYTNAIELSYTATNGFGGRVQEAYRYHFEPDVCGKNTSAEKIR